jgi:RNA polymerase sigma-70 factor (ECF subfamily)
LSLCSKHLTALHSTISQLNAWQSHSLRFMEIKDERELLAMIAKEPEKGFRHLMAQYRDAVYWHIRRLVVSHMDAQDATQETFVRIFRSMSDFKSKGSFRSWIFRIATNEALRILSRRQSDQLSLDDSPVELGNMMADEYVDYSDLEAVKLQNAILSLPAKQQLAFNLRYYNELGYDEIAGIIGSTTDSAKQNYHIAKEKIIKYMNLNN